MSQATRAIALQEAVKSLTKDGNVESPEHVLDLAEKFETWMNQETAPGGNPAGEQPAAATKGKGGAKGKTAAAGAASAAADTASGSETAADTSAEDLKQQVGEALSAAIKVDRDKAVAVLAKAGKGATSLSTIKPAHYAAVLAGLNAMLPDPALS